MFTLCYDLIFNIGQYAFISDKRIEFGNEK